MTQPDSVPVSIQSAAVPCSFSAGCSGGCPGWCLRRFVKTTIRQSWATRTRLLALFAVRRVVLISTPWKKNPQTCTTTTITPLPNCRCHVPSPLPARAPPPCVAKAYIIFCEGLPTPYSLAYVKISKPDEKQMCALEYMLENKASPDKYPIGHTHLRNLTNVKNNNREPPMNQISQTFSRR